MSVSDPGRAALPAGAHAVVSNRRMLELSSIGAAALAALAITFAITLQTPNPDFLLTLGLIVGAAVVIALIVSTRLGLSVALVTVYLGVLDGPVKLETVNQSASAIRDVLIAAVCIGAIIRIIVRKQRVTLPPLSGWVIVFVALVVAEAFNPRTHGALKLLGGFRQQLEWVPFFFFGYVLMRSHERFRKLFVLLGVLALANGMVSLYQTRLTPGQLASWGPGYAERVNGGSTLTARRYVGSNGVSYVRPLALGSDSGFGGSLGVIALPGTLALLATSRRRRWLGIVLCLGSLLAVATGLGRLQVVGAVVAVVAFALLSMNAGPRARRALGAVLAILALALPLGLVLVASEGSAVFSRYLSIAPENVVTTSVTYKEKSLGLIPHYIATAPFGFGLGTTGTASSFGGKESKQLEGHGITAETQYNFVVDELGLPGLILWVALSVQMIALAVTRIPRVRDLDVRVDLAAVFAVIISLVLMGLRGAFMDTAAGGPFFWFALGVAAYWLAAPRRHALRAGLGHTVTVGGAPMLGSGA